MTRAWLVAVALLAAAPVYAEPDGAVVVPYELPHAREAMRRAFWTALTSEQAIEQQASGGTTITPLPFINGAGVANNAVLMKDGTQAAPSIAFASQTDLGFYRTASNVVSFARGNNEIFRFNGSGFTLSTINLGLGNNVAAPDSLVSAVAALFNFAPSGGTPDFNINVNGVPVLSSCNDGVLSTGSSNSSGRVTSATTMVGCTLTFSVTFGGNSADCFIENLTANRGNVTAASSTAFTVANLTAGDDFMYACFGR